MCDVKISVIIPVYNSSNYLCTCIDSITNQTYNSWQMILVDDGSTDHSLAICEEYARNDKRIKVLSQKNAGAGAARNAGLSLSTGEYIVFVDSDDYVSKDYFQFLSEHDEDVVFIDVQAVNESGDVVRDELMSKYKELPKDDFLRSQMTGKINWGGVRKVVKRRVLESNNIRYSNHKVGEEALFTYQSVYYANTIAFIDEPVYFYIQRGNSLSHTKLDDPWGEVALALREETINNRSYGEYADTINAFILTAAAVSSDRLASNYEKREYLRKMKALSKSLMTNLDRNYPIDYKHMSKKANLLGHLLLSHHYGMIRHISKLKHLVSI